MGEGVASQPATPHQTDGGEEEGERGGINTLGARWEKLKRQNPSVRISWILSGFPGGMNTKCVGSISYLCVCFFFLVPGEKGRGHLF